MTTNKKMQIRKANQVVARSFIQGVATYFLTYKVKSRKSRSTERDIRSATMKRGHAPHQGPQERDRRKRQMAQGRLVFHSVGREPFVMYPGARS